MSDGRCTRCDRFGSHQGNHCECSRRFTRQLCRHIWTSYRPLILLGLIWLVVNLLAEVLC